VGEAWWRLATAGTDVAQEELVRTGIAYNEVFADRDEFERVKGWYEGRARWRTCSCGGRWRFSTRPSPGVRETGVLNRIEELEARILRSQPAASGAHIWILMSTITKIAPAQITPRQPKSAAV